MFKGLNLWRNVRDLLLRYLMICVFVFMCIILISTSPKLLGPVFGVFYFIALIYYFWFTMKTEGGMDVNRVKIGQMPFFRWKGALCALILVIPLMILNIIPNFFPDPTPEEYYPYFNGQITELSETDKFNVSLREASGKDGYVSEILFQEDRTVTKLVYVTSDGRYIKCDGTASDDKMYALSDAPLHLSSKNDNVVYFTEKEEMSEADSAAFSECRNAIDDIKTVMGTAPNYQKVFSVIKVVLGISLHYFCVMLVPTGNVALTSLVYCLCLLVLCVAAQVGYEMGYRNIELLRRVKTEKNSKAGDSVVIQRGNQDSVE